MRNKIINALIIIGTFFFLFSCSNEPEHMEQHPGKMISDDLNAQTSCPFLTKDEKGNIVLSWVKEINDSTAMMCYAISTNSGSSFGEPIEISPSKGVQPHGENIPKMTFKPSGEIIAVWGASNPNPNNKYSGMIYYAQSFDQGKSWSNAIPLVTDTASYDQRYFDIAVLQNGEAGIVWLDNRKETTKEGMTLYYASTKGKDGFQNEKTIGETCCECCRTDFFADSKGSLHVAYRDIINDSIRDMVHSVSMDGGNTFSKPKRISADNWIIDGCPHSGPTMTENKSGLHFAWFTESGGTGVYYTNSADDEQTFSPRQLLSTEARHPQMTTVADETVGIIWEETIKKDSAYVSKIVLQLKDPNGQQSTQYITADNVNAGLPVLISNAEKTLVAAWVQETNKKVKPTEHGHHQQPKDGQVFYRMIHL